MSKPSFPGLQIHHDPRNERYLIADRLPAKLPIPRGVRQLTEPAGPVEFTPKTRNWRQYRYVDQGNAPSCTGYGSVMLLAAAHPFNVSPISGDAWYQLNREYDRTELGLDFSEGATVTAALAVGKRLGYYSEYRWAYTVRTMYEAILLAPLIAGTYWYPSMFERTAEQVVRMPSANESPVGGHLYCVNGYDAKRDLWRVPNTWGDGNYLFPGELMHRLVREEGEVAQVTENVLTKKRSVA